MQKFFIIAAAAAAFTVCAVLLYHANWVSAYRNAEKYLEHKYGIKFKTSYSFLNYGISYAAGGNTLFPFFSKMMYHIYAAPEDRPELRFTCYLDNKKEPYHDDYLTVKITYPLLVKTQNVLSQFADNCIVEIAILETVTKDVGDFPSGTEIYIAVNKNKAPADFEHTVENLIKQNFFGNDCSVFLYVTDEEDYRSIAASCAEQLKYLSFFIHAPVEKAGSLQILP
ncbi:hypothetical protein [Treponema pedis]|uniref:Uncharacterized protein n=2 Tax=Treponema pedis TaxID=409322 RepID=S5ZUA4_9SPIR|nr:hypothetical protein [Treponema pedis]AGT43770.1 hypothetical protein TPE_1275 [Treponema pedis str. T A4]